MNSEYVRSEGSVKKYSFVNPAGNTGKRENIIYGVDASLTSISEQVVLLGLRKPTPLPIISASPAYERQSWELRRICKVADRFGK